MHLPKQLTAKLAAALIAVTTVIVPGFAAAAIVTWVVSLATAAPRAETTAEFDAAQELIAKANRDKNFQFEGAAD